MQKISKILVDRTTSRYKERKNEIVPPAIFECVSGPDKGKTRVIYSFIDLSIDKKSDNYYPKVYAYFTDSSGSYRLDDKTSVVYDEEEQQISFSSNEVRYIIRPIQDTDRLIGEEYSPPRKT